MDIFDAVKKGRKRNDKWQDKFLDAFAEEGNLQAAADIANITRQTVYNRLNDDPAFRKKHDEAYARFCASIEREIKRRGFAGSDMLLMAMANRHMPNEYRQNQKVDTTITHDYVIKIGTPRVPAITEANTDTLQDVGTRRVYQSAGDVLE
jgi:hypothetical protein